MSESPGGRVDHAIELIHLGRRTGAGSLPWPHGPRTAIEPTIPSVARVFDRLRISDNSPDAVLILDADFELPEPDLLDRLLSGPADVWHGGVALGLGDQPRSWDRVDPLSMFSAPVDPTIEVTSWRASLRATLVRSDVIRQLGGLDPRFDTLTGAGLDLGLRWIRSGALVRHVPSLVPAGAEPDRPPTPSDGLRLVTRHRGRVWGGWALVRGLGHEVPFRSALRSATGVRSTASPPSVHYVAAEERRRGGDTSRTVSVILPTIDRYSYLETVLHQLASQTVSPHEVFVIDQTPIDHRRSDLTEVEPDLPVRVIEIPVPGQCTARNVALEQSTGELILLLDDDLEIASTLVASHLDALADGIDSVSGGVDDATAGPPPEGFRHRRSSDVFPAGNSVLRRAALVASGLFDPAFDHGARADHDLGMRLHLSGAQLVYDPSIEVYHHHAPVGGLRAHGARKVTRAGSRRSLTQRDLPSVTQRYLALRYFRPDQVEEGRIISNLSQLGGDGSAWRRAARAVVQLLLMPSTLRSSQVVEQDARLLLADRPPIPPMSSRFAESAGE